MDSADDGNESFLSAFDSTDIVTNLYYRNDSSGGFITFDFYNNLCSIYDEATGYIIKQVKVFIPSHIINDESSYLYEGLCISGTILACYIKSSGIFVCYNINTLLYVGYFKKKLKANQTIQSVCPCICDGTFFFTIKGECSIQSFRVNINSTSIDSSIAVDNDKAGIVSSHSIDVSSLMSVELVAFSDNKSMGFVTSIASHPHDDILFVSYSTCQVILWRYQNLFKQDSEEVAELPAVSSICTHAATKIVNVKRMGTNDHRLVCKAIIASDLISRGDVSNISSPTERKALYGSSVVIAIDRRHQLLSATWNDNIITIHDIRIATIPATGSTNAIVLLESIKKPLHNAGKTLCVAFHPIEPILMVHCTNDEGVEMTATNRLKNMQYTTKDIYSMQSSKKKFYIYSYSLCSYVVYRIGSHTCNNSDEINSIERMFVTEKQQLYIVTAYKNSTSRKPCYRLRRHFLSMRWLQNSSVVSKVVSDRIYIPIDALLVDGVGVEMEEIREPLREKIELNSDRKHYINPYIVSVYSYIDIFDSSGSSHKIWINRVRINTKEHSIKGMSTSIVVTLSTNFADDAILPDRYDVNPALIGSCRFHPDKLLSQGMYMFITGCLIGSDGAVMQHILAITSHSHFDADGGDGYAKGSYYAYKDVATHSNDLVAISCDGRSVTKFTNSQGVFTASAVLCIAEVEAADTCATSSYSIIKLWSATSNRLLYLFFDTDKNTYALYLTAAGSVTINMNRCTNIYRLKLNEHIIDAAIQMSSQTDDPVIASTADSDGKSTYDGTIYIAILTNARVVILNSRDMSSMNAYSFPAEGVNRVRSIYWLASVLLLSTESSEVYYMLPYSKAYQCIGVVNNIAQTCHISLKHSLGNHCSNTATVHRLLSLPPSPITILGCFHDRLFYRSIDANVGDVTIASVPFFPVEPLVLSVINKTNADVMTKHISRYTHDQLLSAIITSYYDIDAIGGHNCYAKITSHITKRLFYYYITNILFIQTALIAKTFAKESGRCSSKQEVLSFGIAFYLYYLACCDNSDGANSDGSDTSRKMINVEEKDLQCISSTTSLLLTHSLNAAFYHIVQSLAVSNTSGISRELINLCNHDQLHSESNRTNIRFLTQATPAMKDFNYVYDKLLQLYSLPSVPIDFIPHYTIGSISKKSTSQLTELPGRLSNSLWSISRHCSSQQAIDMAMGCFPMRVSISGGLSNLPPLMLDWIEDWVGGRMLLQPVSTDDSNFTNISSSGNSDKNDSAVDSNTHNNSRNVPLTWVTGVGVGKDWELVSAYWRFSDVVSEHSSSYFSSCDFPGSRCVFMDLSRYNNSLELFSKDANVFSIETTTSMVDPGDDHSKVKSLYDVVYDKVTATTLVYGLRCLVCRGSSLDIGLYHYDNNRCKMTIEMSICCNSTPAGCTNLMKRVCIDDSSGKAGIILWAIEINSNGALSCSIGASTVTTSPGAVTFDGTWTHVAVVFDSTDNSRIDNKDNVAYNKKLSIYIYINGSSQTIDDNEVHTIELPELSAAEVDIMLHRSKLLVGCDMCCGWRITEVKVYSDIRSGSEIEKQRECYLPLASKRKRLQLRVPTPKTLFQPLNCDSFIISDIDCDKIIVNNDSVDVGATVIGVKNESGNNKVSSIDSTVVHGTVNKPLIKPILSVQPPLNTTRRRQQQQQSE